MRVLFAWIPLLLLSGCFGEPEVLYFSCEGNGVSVGVENGVQFRKYVANVVHTLKIYKDNRIVERGFRNLGDRKDPDKSVERNTQFVGVMSFDDSEEFWNRDLNVSYDDHVEAIENLVDLDRDKVSGYRSLMKSYGQDHSGTTHVFNLNVISGKFSEIKSVLHNGAGKSLMYNTRISGTCRRLEGKS